MGIPTLSDRIKAREAEREDRLANRYVPPAPKQAAWLRRMQEKGLPPKDYTGTAAA